jgi:hypothetical protein
LDPEYAAAFNDMYDNIEQGVHLRVPKVQDFVGA